MNGLHHFLPDQNLRRFALAQRDEAVRIVRHPVFVFYILNQNLDDLAYFWLRFIFIPFIERNAAFALESDIDQHMFVIDPQYLAVNDTVYIKRAFSFDQRQHIVALVNRTDFGVQ